MVDVARCVAPIYMHWPAWSKGAFLFLDWESLSTIIRLQIVTRVPTVPDFWTFYTHSKDSTRSSNYAQNNWHTGYSCIIIACLSLSSVLDWNSWYYCVIANTTLASYFLPSWCGHPLSPSTDYRHEWEGMLPREDPEWDNFHSNHLYRKSIVSVLSRILTRYFC